MSITLRRQEKREQIRTAVEKMMYCLIFSRDIFYVTIVLCLNILWLKAVNEITARQTRSGLCKHDVIKVCSIRHLTTQIELVLPTFFQPLDRSQTYRILTSGLLSSLWNIYHCTTAYFLTHPVYSAEMKNRIKGALRTPRSPHWAVER